MPNDPLRTAEANNAALTGQANVVSPMRGSPLAARDAQLEQYLVLMESNLRLALRSLEQAQSDMDELRAERDRLQFQYNAALEELDELKTAVPIEVSMNEKELAQVNLLLKGAAKRAAGRCEYLARSRGDAITAADIRREYGLDADTDPLGCHVGRTAARETEAK